MSERLFPCPVEFDPQRHVYKLNGRELSSVSSLIRRVSPQFDPDGSILRRCAGREGITPEQLRARWDAKRDKSVVRGRALHTAVEKWVQTGVEEQGYERSFEQLKMWPFKGRLFSEVILWCEQDLIAGTTDLVEKICEGVARLYDFKTNEKLERFNRYGNKLLPPVAHLDGTEFQKYELQLSFYALMLERFGWKVERLTIFHIDENQTWKSHRVDYKKAECEMILDSMK